MNTDKLAINWQNFAQVQLQLRFAFIIRPLNANMEKVMLSKLTDINFYNAWAIERHVRKQCERSASQRA